MKEQQFTQELEEVARDYKSLKEQEGVNFQKLTAKQLSSEIKEAIGIDVFPEDIQDEILTLSQKLADYVLELTEQSEEELPPWGQKLINCAADAPSSALHRDALNNARTVWGAGAGARFGPLKSYRLPLSIGAYGATLLGGFAGHMTGCMQRPSPFRPPGR
jgi:hypothetical protein